MPINRNPSSLPPLLVDPKSNMSPLSSNFNSQSSSLTLTTTNSKTNNNGNDSNNNNSQLACAVCKYQRRRCSPQCPLAPYFPPDNQQQFLNAHRLFGVRNILRIIKNLDPASRDDAMGTIIFQSNARALDPVGGCYRIIFDLQEQIERESAELEIVRQQLALLRGDQLCYEGIEGMMLNLERREEKDVVFDGGGVVQEEEEEVKAAHFVETFTCR